MCHRPGAGGKPLGLRLSEGLGSNVPLLNCTDILLRDGRGEFWVFKGVHIAVVNFCLEKYFF